MSLPAKPLFALAALTVLFGCGDPAPVRTSLSALTAAQLDFDGRQVLVRGTLRTFDSPRHYWIENEALDRVALAGADELAAHVGLTVEVRGIFTYDRNVGRRIEVKELRTLPSAVIETTATNYERLLDARIGVAVTDTETGRSWHYRGSERFPLTSTFKPLACAAWLAKVDSGVDELDRSVVVRPDQIVTYSPVTRQFADAEMTLEQACEAAITVSDNTAGNLLLAAIDGPPGLTAFLRRIGDNETRLDRIEPFLNEAVPGDPRDTTTPDAMVETLMALLSGGGLSAASARLLENWLVADRVADELFRSRLPAGWRIGDKTGAGGNGSRALIAVLYPPGRKEAIAAVYITQTEADFAARNEAIADIGAAIFEVLMQQARKPR